MKITDLRLTPVAVPEHPVCNAKGCHGDVTLRTVIEVETDQGLVGLGETYGDTGTIRDLHTAKEIVVGMDPYQLSEIEERLKGVAKGSGTFMSSRGPADPDRRLFAALEVPCLDLQAKAAGRPLVDLLGGRHRQRVPFAAYLFFKHATDRWALEPYTSSNSEFLDRRVMSPEAMLEEARSFVDRYGFGSLKLKAGVLSPDAECETIELMAEAFPGVPLRIDPNGAWTVETTLEVARRLTGLLEYLEDPVLGVEGMASVASQVEIPLATNMIVTSLDDLPSAVAKHACQIILGDHHYWGGIRRVIQLATICGTWGMGFAMHSNSHLGISLAAMVHTGAAIQDIDYSFDTHRPWQAEYDVITEPLEISDGTVAVPSGPGLGVEIDHDALGRLHELYLNSDTRSRDDVAEMQKYDPSWTGVLPRF